MRTEVVHGDCLSVLRGMADGSVDAIVTDPPAGIAFMGKEWDRDKGGRDQWVAWMAEVATECLRVIKPGGHALVWAIPRTSHWTGMAWEQVGWEPRDKVYHAFGSGFPKSLDVGKAIDKAAGAERKVVGERIKLGDKKAYPQNPTKGNEIFVTQQYQSPITAPATPEAKQWDGWGTALKPAVEEWWLFRRPLVGTVVANVLAHGTGALNIDGCRVGTEEWTRSASGDVPSGKTGIYGKRERIEQSGVGRWPAHLVLTPDADVLGVFPDTGQSNGRPRNNNEFKSVAKGRDLPRVSYGPHDAGSAARYYAQFERDAEDDEAQRLFYCAKASKRDRDEGLDDSTAAMRNDGRTTEIDNPYQRGKVLRNPHPTVKATALMRWLCRLITPPCGLVLDPFCGSGSTGKAAVLEGFEFVGIEREAEYVEIARRRIDAVIPPLLKEA